MGGGGGSHCLNTKATTSIKKNLQVAVTEMYKPKEGIPLETY